jgi:hypothetical protein
LKNFGKAVPLCVDPIAKSAKDLALFMDVATTQSIYNGIDNPYTKIIPFDWNIYINCIKKAIKNIE